MATPFILGLGVAASAIVAKQGIKVGQKLAENPEYLKKMQATAAGFKGMKGAFKMPNLGAFTGKFTGNTAGGFDATMSRGEAAKILGIGERSNKAQIKEAHRKVMMLNHPDRGGSPYIASKINEASECLQGQRRSSGSAFS